MWFCEAFTCYSQTVTGKDASSILTSGFVHTVKDPLWGNIPMRSEMRELLSLPDVEKLSRIKQNGPSYRIYPGAVHTRLSHSIGVYHIARRMLLSAVSECTSLPLTETGINSFLIMQNEELNAGIRKTGADPFKTAAIIDTELPSDDAEISFYRSVLSGTLDPDKLDYLSRDAFFAGVPYGKQDTDFIISSISYGNGSIVLDEEALSLVEQVLFSKYMMYRSLYWHKGVRSATCMIKKAIISALDDGIIDFSDLYLKDDDEFRHIADRYPSYAPFSLIEKAEHGILFERKAMKNHDPDGCLERKADDIRKRKEAENEIYELLKPGYSSLKPYEVIIDIPEPISFETRIMIRLSDGRIRETENDEIIFSQAGKLFSRNLRKTALYLPPYIANEDAERAFMEADRG